MKMTYDPGTDTLSIVLAPGDVAESDEDRPGVILDDDAAGNLVGVEILDVSENVADAAGLIPKITG